MGRLTNTTLKRNHFISEKFKIVPEIADLKFLENWCKHCIEIYNSLFVKKSNFQMVFAPFDINEINI